MPIERFFHDFEGAQGFRKIPDLLLKRFTRVHQDSFFILMRRSGIFGRFCHIHIHFLMGRFSILSTHIEDAVDEMCVHLTGGNNLPDQIPDVVLMGAIRASGQSVDVVDDLVEVSRLVIGIKFEI